MFREMTKEDSVNESYNYNDLGFSLKSKGQGQVHPRYKGKMERKTKASYLNQVRPSRKLRSSTMQSGYFQARR